jgi:hypothetical protein
MYCDRAQDFEGRDFLDHISGKKLTNKVPVFNNLCRDPDLDVRERIQILVLRNEPI